MSWRFFTSTDAPETDREALRAMENRERNLVLVRNMVEVQKS
jgi:hypothetical protein